MTKTTIETITRKQIGQLNHEAAQAGDDAMVDLTQSVLDDWKDREYLDSMPGRISQCVAAINAAEASDDSADVDGELYDLDTNDYVSPDDLGIDEDEYAALVAESLGSGDIGTVKTSAGRRVYAQ